MKVTQEKLPESQIGLEIEVPADLSKQVYEQTIKKLAREVNLPGFRKGKVPRHILVQRLGHVRVKASALEDLVQKSMDQAIEQEKIEAIGNYQLTSSFDALIEAYNPGEPVVFSASVDVPPQPTLKQYKGLAVKAEEIQPDTGKVDTVLGDYRKQLATLVPVEDREAQSDDIAVIDFVGHLDLPADAPEGAEPEEIPGGKGEDFQVELSEGRFIPGFIEGIIGMKIDENKQINATFPKDYPQAEVAGKAATFDVTLKELKERELPDLNDDFAKEVSDFETIAELRESLETRYTDEAEQKTKNNKHEALYNALVEQIEVELPVSMIERESNFLFRQTLMNLSEQGIDVNKMITPELAESFRKQAQPEAIERLKRTLALGEIAKQELIKVEDDAIDAKVGEILESTRENSKNIDLGRLRSVVEEDLLKDEIMTWLEQHCTVELVPEGTLKAAAEEDAEDAVGATAVEAAEAVAAEEDTEEDPEEAAIAVEVEVVDAQSTPTKAREPKGDKTQEPKPKKKVKKSK